MGAYGKAEWCAATGYWDIVDCGKLAEMCFVVFTGTTLHISAVYPCGDFQAPKLRDSGYLEDTAGTVVSIENPWGLFPIVEGTAGFIVRENTGNWQLVALIPSLSMQSVITDIQRSGDNVQVKTRQVWIVPYGAETGWGTVFGLG